MQGDKVAGELVNLNGEVVDVVESTTNNPFSLTAPAAGTYLVNGGAKQPSRIWDSVSVNLTVTDIQIDDFPVTPTQMELLGNHPNPFNNETVIRFALPTQGPIELLIFNINGEVIRHLLHDTFSPAFHNIRWDGKNDSGQIVASGVYIYQLICERHQLTKRLVFAK